MATTTMGQTTPDVTPKEYNKWIYWAIAAALAVLLIFAFSTNKTESVVTPADQVNAPVTTPVERTPAAMDKAPAMDSTPTNSMMSSPDSTVISPQTDTISNEGVNADQTIKMLPSQPAGVQEPGTSVSPEAPKGTVVR
tara:strand:+ start:26172 stop:26585 length:414 start_codon:yes stop_codon:yes gene_type:complete